jgi:enamine deaminase RidA (YjgF/YER057c/UK114 family)
MQITQSADRRLAHFGVPWEEAYGYAQAVASRGMLYVAGQLSHDGDGNLIAPAPVDEAGKVTDFSAMEEQMRASYANARRLLEGYGVTLADVVEETIYVLDVDAAFAVAGTVRKAAYGTDRPGCASTIAGTTRLAFPQQLVEISLIALLPEQPARRGGGV